MPIPPSFLSYIVPTVDGFSQLLALSLSSHMLISSPTIDSSVLVSQTIKNHTSQFM